MHPSPVICYGEVLWDLLPNGKVAGGAPMNVAYHLNNLGTQTLMMSSVGKDKLGWELLEFLQANGISTDFIDIIEEQATGTADVQLDQQGKPTYHINGPAAWDFITYEAEDLQFVRESRALVYGSLACRNTISRKTLLQLLAVAPLKIFDLNLRPPFYTQERIEQLLDLADIVKLSDFDLEQISSWDQKLKGLAPIKLIEILKSKFSLKGILCTLGKEGALYLDDQAHYQQDSFAIKVIDTVGSGDAFLAAFIKNLLAGAPASHCLKNACAMGALAASKIGGTPRILEKDLLQFINQEKFTERKLPI